MPAGESIEDLISFTQLLRKDALGDTHEVLTALREVFTMPDLAACK